MIKTNTGVLSAKNCGFGNVLLLLMFLVVMGIKGRRVHMIEELSETIISFQRGNMLKGVNC